MTKREELKDVPEDKVSSTVNQFVKSGATSIEVLKQGNGKWTIRAKFSG